MDRLIKYFEAHTAIYSIEILRKSLKSLSILLVPSTTQYMGSSAMHTGSPVSSRIRLSRFFSKAPPPASTMRRSLMSAESSGGVCSSHELCCSTLASHQLKRVVRHSMIPPAIKTSSIATVSVVSQPH